MTTIASFATIQTTDNPDVERKITAMYLLADSQISKISNGVISIVRQNAQKVFFNKECKLILGYYGDTIAGDKILNIALNSINANASIQLASSPMLKKSAIKNHFDTTLNNIGINIITSQLTLLCITIYAGSFFVFTLTVNPTNNSFTINDQPFFTQTKIFVGGSGMQGFEHFLEIYKDRYPDENESAVFFRSFCEYLSTNQDPYSSLPCQGIVLNLQGEIKLLSIKHPDEFYLLGNQHLANIRANLNSQVDYRDFHFEFLHSNGRIRGGNRKKYFRGEA